MTSYISKSKRIKSPVYRVSTWANENNLVLGLDQVSVNDNSNEITIPALLGKLLIQGNVISIDAMGTQNGIIEKIIKKKAEYI